MQRKKEMMDMGLFRKIVDDFCDMGGGDVILTPQIGDVFNDKYLIERIQYMCSKGGVDGIGFVTNAIATDKYNDDELHFIVNSTQRIQISLYGFNEEEYSTMTRKDGMFVKAVEGVKRILSVNEKSKLTFALRLLHIREDTEIRQWILDMFDENIPYETTLEYANWGGAMDVNKPLPFDAKWLPVPDGRRATPCLYPIMHIKILVNGDVKFCSCADYDNMPENTTGNVGEESLSAIYNGSCSKELWRKGLSLCNSCTYYKPLSNLELLFDYLDQPIENLGV